MKSTQIDSYLFLEDLNGNVLAQDDDSGGFPNARIIYTPSYSGYYNVVATSFKQGETGAYTIYITP
jgi:serine protease Do